MWTQYFKLVKLRRGRVITPSHGEIDFSRDDIPVEICKELFEKDFLYLEITEEGKKELYGIVTEEEVDEVKDLNEIKEVKEEEGMEVLEAMDEDPVFEPLPNADDNPDEIKVSEPVITKKRNAK